MITGVSGLAPQEARSVSLRCAGSKRCKSTPRGTTFKRKNPASDSLLDKLAVGTMVQAAWL